MKHEKKKKSTHQKWICKSLQEELPAGSFVFPFLQTGHRSGQGSILSGRLQSPLPGSPAEKQVATISRPQLPEQVPKGPNLQIRLFFFCFVFYF